MEAGDKINFDYGGGGGWGDPLDRPAAAVLDDVLDEYVSVEGARRDYGVVLAGSLEDLTLRDRRGGDGGAGGPRCAGERGRRPEPADRCAAARATGTSGFIAMCEVPADLWDDRSMSAGIAAWGTYLPYWRLQRAAIAGVLGSGGGRGTRAVASHDEDTTTLGVEAGRRALAVGPGAGAVQDLFLSTPDPAYLDKTSATTVHAALGLGRAVRCLRLRRLVALGRGCAAAGARRGGRCRAHHPGRRVATCAPVWPVRPRSATAATVPRRSSARPTAPWRS